ncbi:MAG TPA: class I SAM-dependent methyltransferase [Pyrinomonadaceae bacterium]|nr:class I SAM-dependent methyltransferase [Pyrinomonadaceae bacterium]
MNRSHYVIRGGLKGRERLRLLSRIMRPATLSLFEKVGLHQGLACIDVGCGGGDVTFELARLVGASGRVVGTDIDLVKLELARSEAEQRQLSNVEFQLSDISESKGEAEFDVVYARFLLTHLKDPAGALERMRQLLRPNGFIVIEDIDFTGHFCYPECIAFRRYVELYTDVVRRRGGDPNIGPRIPLLLIDAGFETVQMNVVQPSGIKGEVKFISPITMENISETVQAEGLASKEDIDEVINELYKFARNWRTVASMPRVVQAWGTR